MVSCVTRPSCLGLAASPAVARSPWKSRFCSKSRWPNGRCTRPCSPANEKPDFAQQATTDYGIDAVEYVNQFFKDKAKDQVPGRDEDALRRPGREKRADHDRRRGQPGRSRRGKRTKAVENHYPWVEAAKFLGCHSIRVNAYSKGTPEEQAKLATDGLRRSRNLPPRRNQRDRREPRRPVLERQMAGGSDEGE